MQFYTITMNDPLLNLSPNPQQPIGSPLQIENATDSLLQHWFLPYCPTTLDEEYGFAIANRATGQIIQAASNDKNSAVVMVDYASSALSNLNTWSIQYPYVNNDFAAIRPSCNSNLNLNAKGDSWPAGTKIILWPWDGPTNNMIWRFTPVDSYS